MTAVQSGDMAVRCRPRPPGGGRVPMWTLRYSHRSWTLSRPGTGLPGLRGVQRRFPRGVLVRGRLEEPEPFDLAEVNRKLAALGGAEE